MSSEKKKSSVLEIALCHGTFDLLHPGHVELFRHASEISDWVVVSLTADEYCLKGPGRPVHNHWERASLISSVRYVDEVRISYSKDALAMIQRYKPKFFVKGGDYETNDKLGHLSYEKKEVEYYGGKVVLAPHAGYSTSDVINRIRKIP